MIKKVELFCFFMAAFLVLVGCQGPGKDTTKKNTTIKVNGFTFEQFDINNDGFVVESEVEAKHKNSFEVMDLNKNSFVEKQEHDTVMMSVIMGLSKKAKVKSEDFVDNLGSTSKFIDERFEKKDQNKDGKLVMEEVVKDLESKKKNFMSHDLNGDRKVSKLELDTVTHSRMLKMLGDMQAKAESTEIQK